MEAAARQLLLLLLKRCLSHVVHSYHAARAEAALDALLQPLQTAATKPIVVMAEADGVRSGTASQQQQHGTPSHMVRDAANHHNDGVIAAVGHTSPAVACQCCSGGTCCARHLEWALERVELRDREAELLQELGCMQVRGVFNVVSQIIGSDSC